MPAINKPSNAPGTSLGYITVGAILAVLAGTSFFFFSNSQNAVFGYIRTCAFIIGLILLVLGFSVGQIGRVARAADEAPAPGGVTPPPAARPANGTPLTAVPSGNGVGPILGSTSTTTQAP